ncbi:MAG: YaaR family protein [Oscillospiraceae bacterium]|nr:YaaR family protein [Oscillospiraceae bacterium]
MKIQNIKTSDFGLQPVRTVDTTEETREGTTVFQRTLTTLSKEQHKIHLTGLIAEIDQQAEKLSKRADIKEFEKYRKLIRDFLDEIVSNGYAFTKENAYGAGRRHRFFATIKTIDENLDEMAKSILSEQSGNIELLHRIDDIRGLLLDMIL